MFSGRWEVGGWKLEVGGWTRKVEDSDFVGMLDCWRVGMFIYSKRLYRLKTLLLSESTLLRGTLRATELSNNPTIQHSNFPTAALRRYLFNLQIVNVMGEGGEADHRASCLSTGGLGSLLSREFGHGESSGLPQDLVVTLLQPLVFLRIWTGFSNCSGYAWEYLRDNWILCFFKQQDKHNMCLKSMEEKDHPILRVQ